MRKLTTQFGTVEFEVSEAKYRACGYLHHKITVELDYNGNRELFSSVTDKLNEPSDSIDLNSDDLNEELYDLIFHSIEFEIVEWIEEFLN